MGKACLISWARSIQEKSSEMCFTWILQNTDLDLLKQESALENEVKH